MKAMKVITCAAICLTSFIYSCKNNGNTETVNSEAALKPRVEELMKVEYFTPDNRALYFGEELCGLYKQIDTYRDSGDLYLDFQWSGKVLDACCEDPNLRKATLLDLRFLTDSTAEADINFVDPPCYDINYTLLLGFNGEKWMIEDVVWKHKDIEPTKETDEAKAYLKEQENKRQ